MKKIKVNNEELKNFKVIKCESLSIEEIEKNEREENIKRKQKREIQKIFNKRILKNNISKKTYKLSNKLHEKINIKEYEFLQYRSTLIVNKAIKIVTYLQNKKWTSKNDALIVDFNINIEEKKDLISEVIENILKNGFIYEHILYIKNKSFKSLKNTSILNSKEHYKKVNSLLYYIKKRSVEVNDIIKVNDEEMSASDLQTFKNYIIDMYNSNDLKNEYKKATQKQFASNILKLLNLTKKEMIVYNFILQGLNNREISKILQLNEKGIAKDKTRINKKIEVLKSELYINYMIK